VSALGPELADQRELITSTSVAGCLDIGSNRPDVIARQHALECWHRRPELSAAFGDRQYINGSHCAIGICESHARLPGGGESSWGSPRHRLSRCARYQRIDQGSTPGGVDRRPEQQRQFARVRIKMVAGCICSLAKVPLMHPSSPVRQVIIGGSDCSLCVPVAYRIGRRQGTECLYRAMRAGYRLVESKHRFVRGVTTHREISGRGSGRRFECGNRLNRMATTSPLRHDMCSPGGPASKPPRGTRKPSCMLGPFESLNFPRRLSR
jgi:hypothetical protein